ncbi:NACHT domain-containing protein [Pseudonocardia ailaonensis]|uniref:NACHT domain-containing protein n=1 Tax=Pseudonocardia ailaonensis TaxID=367279 RepID=A0ABN2NHT1_9PSEU
MSLEATGLSLGKTVAKLALKRWTQKRAARISRESELMDLVSLGGMDRFQRRKFERQVDDIVDHTTKRLEQFYMVEFRNLPENEKSAALEAVVDSLLTPDIDDNVLFANDVDARKISEEIRRASRVKVSTALLSSDAYALYDRVLDDCCIVIVEILKSLPEFTGRAVAELLSRFTEATNRLDEVLAALPRTGLHLNDSEFLTRYMRSTIESQEALEIFGIDTRNYRPRSRVSVAYMTLSVSSGVERRQQHQAVVNVDDDEIAEGAGASRSITSSLSVESALGESQRTLIVGNAGSGKTTLLQWIAVTAARSEFTGPLVGWNSLVPFVLKLRSWSGNSLPEADNLVSVTAPELSAFKPEGWEHIHLVEGKAILLVDGVDEIGPGRRRSINSSLKQFSSAYPEVPIVVTSRPSAVEKDWLKSAGFTQIQLEPMSVPDVAEFLHRWHTAIGEAAREGDVSLPCDPPELDRYETSLHRQLAARRHLQSLATNPLMCAMLCALNLDRQTRLPADRMKLYEDAILLLLERRDSGREIPAAQLSGELPARLALTILRHLAWRMTLAGRAEMGVSTALNHVGHVIGRMPTIVDDASKVLQHLLERSGLLRSPTQGKVDFVHKTFQEYLAAQEAIDEHYIDVLLSKATRDSWREVIVMAAGHATRPLREQLINGLLDQAGDGTRRSRQIRLLTAACLETAKDELLPETSAKVDRVLSSLIPPARLPEARALAILGDDALKMLPASLEGLRDTEAAACVECAAFVGNDRSLRMLSGYASDARPRVQAQLVNAWRYFDTEKYAREVLADAPLDRGRLQIGRTEVLPYLGYLKNLTSVHFEASRSRVLSDLRCFAEIPFLRIVSVKVEGTVDLSPLQGASNLLMLSVFGDHTGIRGLGTLQSLSELRSLQLQGVDSLELFEALSNSPQISHLTLNGASGLRELSAIPAFEKLRSLDLFGLNGLRNIDRLAEMSEHLTGLSLQPFQVSGGLKKVAQVAPNLTFLNVHDGRNLRPADLLGLPLERLWLRDCELGDISVLTQIESLSDVSLYGSKVDRVETLASLPRLRRLDLRAAMQSIDLQPFIDAGGPKIDIVAGVNQSVEQPAPGQSRVRLVFW